MTRIEVRGSFVIDKQHVLFIPEGGEPLDATFIMGSEEGQNFTNAVAAVGFQAVISAPQQQAPEQPQQHQQPSFEANGNSLAEALAKMREDNAQVMESFHQQAEELRAEQEKFRKQFSSTAEPQGDS